MLSFFFTPLTVQIPSLVEKLQTYSLIQENHFDIISPAQIQKIKFLAFYFPALCHSCMEFACLVSFLGKKH